jgi:hypothetical protein
VSLDTELHSSIIIYSHNEHSFSPGNKNNTIGVLVTRSIDKDWLDGCPRTVRVQGTHKDKQSRKRRRVTGTSHSSTLYVRLVACRPPRSPRPIDQDLRNSMSRNILQPLSLRLPPTSTLFLRPSRTCTHASAHAHPFCSPLTAS